jgi:hypothetical protein
MAGLRSASRATIALGGPVFACDPDRALALGADFVAADARKAVAEAGAHLSTNLRRRMN